MKAKYRIEMIRPGINYGYRYQSSLSAAIKFCNRVGFATPGGHASSWDDTPFAAKIEESVLDPFGNPHWKLVAEMDATGTKLLEESPQEEPETVRLGQVERLVLGLLAVHGGNDVSDRYIANELERPVDQITKIVVRLMDKGVVGENRLPLARKTGAAGR